MYTIRKVGTSELMSKGYKIGFHPARDSEDVWLWRRRQDAEYRLKNCMGYKEQVFEAGKWVLRYVPFSWAEQAELEIVEVEVVLNVRNQE